MTGTVLVLVVVVAMVVVAVIFAVVERRAGPRAIGQFPVRVVPVSGDVVVLATPENVSPFIRLRRRGARSPARFSNWIQYSMAAIPLLFPGSEPSDWDRSTGVERGAGSSFRRPARGQSSAAAPSEQDETRSRTSHPFAERYPYGTRGRAQPCDHASARPGRQGQQFALPRSLDRGRMRTTPSTDAGRPSHHPDPWVQEPSRQGPHGPWFEAAIRRRASTWPWRHLATLAVVASRRT